MTGPSLAQRPPKVLVTKVGLDGHDRGSRLVTTHRRDARMEGQIAKFKSFKAERNQAGVARALDALARAAGTESDNLFEKVVDAAIADVTHGEICACLRRELGFGQPLVVA